MSEERANADSLDGLVVCDGECEPHKGEIVRVHVKDGKTGYDWGHFNYCESAIMEDESRGLMVTPVADNK